MKSLQEFKTTVTTEIEAILSRYETDAHSIDPVFADLVHDMKTFLTHGGKRLRAYFMYLAYVGFGGKDEEAIVPIAAALELLHGFLLIHDDVIDMDTVRYGMPNITGMYEHKLSVLPHDRARHIAESAAILAGDVAHIMSSQLVMNSSFSDAVKVAVSRCIFEATMRVAGGEHLDVMVSVDPQLAHITEERLLSMYYNKTASYTFELPLRVGALLAREAMHGAAYETSHEAVQDTAHQADIVNIQKFARAIGIAYQITDDILGVFGDAVETGKSNDSDIREGKRTLLYAKAMNVLPEDIRARFASLYGKAHATAEEIAEVRMILEQRGVRAEAQALVEKLNTAAIRTDFFGGNE
jgi:geranylgeranyl diphosphate synthase type II